VTISTDRRETRLPQACQRKASNYQRILRQSLKKALRGCGKHLI
jgi:hypothetical protein